MGWYSLNELIKTTDMTHRVTGGTGQHSGLDNAFHNYIGTDYVLWSQANNSYDYPFQLTYDNGNLAMNATSPNYGMICLPIIPSNIGKIEFDIKFTPYPSGYQTQDFMLILDYDSFSFLRLIKRQPPTITGEWEHIEIDVDEPTETFYFTMTSRCCWEMKNIKFYVVDVSPSGGAGSGYIGNSLVSNKKMVGYNVPTSSAESTKTESVTEASENPVSGKPKIGNGYAKIRFLRPLEEKSIVAEMLASNQFKINGTGEAPTIYSGSMGSYDSSTNSYYFSSNCGMDWKNWSNIGMTLEKAQKLTKIEFEYEGMVRDNALGRSFDMQMQTYFNTNLLFVNGIADGYDDSSSDKQKFARIKNSGSDQWETTEQVPFNSSQYQNAFHKVKWVWEIENSVAKKITIYLDDVVFCTHTDIDYEFEITALGNQFLRCDVIDHTNVKSVKIAFFYMG